LFLEHFLCPVTVNNYYGVSVENKTYWPNMTSCVVQSKLV